MFEDIEKEFIASSLACGPLDSMVFRKCEYLSTKILEDYKLRTLATTILKNKILLLFFVWLVCSFPRIAFLMEHFYKEWIQLLPLFTFVSRLGQLKLNCFRCCLKCLKGLIKMNRREYWFFIYDEQFLYINWTFFRCMMINF